MAGITSIVTSLLNGQRDEVLVNLKPSSSALFRVELGGDQVAPNVDATERDAVLGDAGHRCLVLRLGVIAVDEVEVASRGYVLKRWMPLLEFDAIPAHVRHFQPLRQPPDHSGNYAQAGGVAFLGTIQQQLQAQAYPQERPSRSGILPQRLHTPPPLNGFHSCRAGANSRQDNGMGVC